MSFSEKNQPICHSSWGCSFYPSFDCMANQAKCLKKKDSAISVNIGKVKKIAFFNFNEMRVRSSTKGVNSIRFLRLLLQDKIFSKRF